MRSVFSLPMSLPFSHSFLSIPFFSQHAVHDAFKISSLLILHFSPALQHCQYGRSSQSANQGFIGILACETAVLREAVGCKAESSDAAKQQWCSQSKWAKRARSAAREAAALEALHFKV